MNELMNFDKSEDIEKEILSQIQHIPFGNSHAQTESVVNAALVPEKAYKVLSLRLMSRLRDLKTCSIKRRQAENQVKKLKWDKKELRINRAGSDLIKIEEERLDLEIELIESGFDYEDKLANDCKDELTDLYKMFKQLPEYTREEFEKGDEQWLKLKTHAVKMQLGEPTVSGLARAIKVGDVKRRRKLTK